MDTVIHVSIGEPYTYWSERALEFIESVYEPHGDGAVSRHLGWLTYPEWLKGRFSDTTNNSIATGTVTLIDDDTGLAMFSVTDMAPLASAIECIEDEYARSLPSLNPVVLYAGANGAGDTGLGTYLDLKIEVGIGHVILFETPRRPDVLTAHRVSAIDSQARLFITRGDANPRYGLEPGSL